MLYRDGVGIVQPKALILTADKFEDIELFFIVFRLLEDGWQVDVAAPHKRNIAGENGYGLMPRKDFDEVAPDEYGLLVVPGGAPDGAPAVVRGSERARDIVRAFFDAGKPVASICHGPGVLVSAGLARGRRLTSFWKDGLPQEIRDAGGHWEDKDVVVDGNLVTARCPTDLPVFMREVMRLARSTGHCTSITR
jgi:protease I